MGHGPAELSHLGTGPATGHQVTRLRRRRPRVQPEQPGRLGAEALQLLHLARAQRARAAKRRSRGPASTITTIAPTTIVTPQNGVGNEELLAEAFGADNVVAAALTVPVGLDPSGKGVAAKGGGIAFAGRAVAAGPITDGPAGDAFRAEILEVVHTHLNETATMLVVEWWTPTHGLRRIERA